MYTNTSIFLLFSDIKRTDLQDATIERREGESAIGTENASVIATVTAATSAIATTIVIVTANDHDHATATLSVRETATATARDPKNVATDNTRL